MQVTQLYIQNERIDLFQDEVISLTQTIQNVRDIEKVFTDFSKSFTIPASKTNNKIFKHYYNFDIDNGFEARKKASARLEINNLPFRDGKVKLEGVDLKNNKPYAYKITFFGNTVNLKDVLGDAKLSSLTWLNNFRYSYSESAVRTLMQSGYSPTVDSVTYTDAVLCPLISYDQLITISAPNVSATYDKFKYAIRLWVLIKAIEEEGLITFTDDSFLKQTDNPQFYNLYMWMHRKEGDVLQGVQATIFYASFPTDVSSMTRVGSYGGGLYVQGLTTGQALPSTLSIFTSTTDDYTIEIKKDGFTVVTQVISGGGNENINLNLTNSFGYTVNITGAVTSPATTFSCTWYVNDFYLGESNSYVGTSQPITGFFFNPIDQLPDMKIIDFLSGLFKMFNLTAYEVAGKLRVLPLDDFYSEGTIRDITQYVDTTQSSVNVALPYKEISFQYEGRGTFLSKQYEQENEIGWGTIEYRGDDIFDGETYEVTLPFEHMQYYRVESSTIQIGQFSENPLTNTTESSPYFDKPLLFYPISRSGNTVTISGTGITTYYIPSNSVDINAATNDDTCHFSVEINEYTGGTEFTGSLFANYYQDYISDVFNSKRRLTKVKAHLPVGFLISYTLADTLRIATREYKINSITTNLNTGESDLELLNVV